MIPRVMSPALPSHSQMHILGTAHRTAPLRRAPLRRARSRPSNIKGPANLQLRKPTAEQPPFSSPTRAHDGRRRLGRRPDLPRPPAAVSAFADAFVDFAVSGIFFPTATASTPSPPTTTTTTTSPPTTFLPSPSRLVAIGDLHGDLPKSLAALRLAGLVPPSNGADAPSTSWSAGPTLALQLGDILDRGGDEIRLLAQGVLRLGRVVPRRPRHQAPLQRPRPSQEPFLGVPKAFPVSNPSTGTASAPASPRSARTDPSRGGSSPTSPPSSSSATRCSSTGGLLEANVEYGLERINAEVSEWIRGERGPNAGVPEYVCGRDAVVWLRRFSEGFNCDCQRLEGILGMIPGAKRMIMGHTIQTEGITAVCGAQAVRVDVGLSRGCGNGLPEVLEINGGGTEVRIITTDPADAWQYRKQREVKKAATVAAVKEKKG
ncbi:hypothetical protein GUJ93_ZPchr0574g12 [Zizania palustris]|uniref:Calcineurin-like phosphoesterase domain-containing protein n=1 Tax=Zizania palustris TaxID=103762 RepID=A0A8J5SW18_ZIZPA|nr:hypothetical protein GUJ93_ZPchr0574g12 [Zizania palustris]